MCFVLSLSSNCTIDHFITSMLDWQKYSRWLRIGGLLIMISGLYVHYNTGNQTFSRILLFIGAVLYIGVIIVTLLQRKKVK